MIKIFVIQLCFALLPSVCGLFLLAYVSPKLYRQAKTSLQFDLLTGLLTVALLAVLAGLNLALVNETVIAKTGALGFIWSVSLPADQDAASRLYSVYFLSLLATPAIMFARLVLDMFFEKPLDLES